MLLVLVALVPLISRKYGFAVVAEQGMFAVYHMRKPTLCSFSLQESWEY